jgi:hypothetical protein
MPLCDPYLVRASLATVDSRVQRGSSRIMYSVEHRVIKLGEVLDVLIRGHNPNTMSRPDLRGAYLKVP